jgi:cation diffusion facilitator family transporter
MPSFAISYDRTMQVAAGSIVVALVVLALKYVSYLWTGSAAIYSDALESIVNVMTALAALVAIRVSLQPADRTHPFGHHKAEYFAAVLEGVLIVLAAILILREAYDAFVKPRYLEDATAGLAMNGLATALNGAWSWFLISRGRAWRSPALVADGWHLLTDVLTSVGVIVGLVLAAITGWTILDPLLAVVVAVNILFAGYQITLDSMSGLLDRSAGSEVEEQIRAAIRSSGVGALEAHDIRTRHAGSKTFIEFHLVVPGEMTVLRAHEICDCIEQEVEAAIDGAEVLIHVEPDHKAKAGRGAVLLG